MNVPGVKRHNAPSGKPHHTAAALLLYWPSMKITIYCNTTAVSASSVRYTAHQHPFPSEIKFVLQKHGGYCLGSESDVYHPVGTSANSLTFDGLKPDCQVSMRDAAGL